MDKETVVIFKKMLASIYSIILLKWKVFMIIGVALFLVFKIRLVTISYCY